MDKKDMLEPKRILRVGFDFALSMMRAAAQGTTKFVDEKGVKLPERASHSMKEFFDAAVRGAAQTVDEVKKERDAQDKEDKVRAALHPAEVRHENGKSAGGSSKRLTG